MTTIERPLRPTSKISLLLGFLLLVVACVGPATIPRNNLIDAKITQVIQKKESAANRVGFAVHMFPAGKLQESNPILIEFYRYSDFYNRPESNQNDEPIAPFDSVITSAPKLKNIEEGQDKDLVFDFNVSPKLGAGKYILVIKTKTDEWRTNPFVIPSSNSQTRQQTEKEKILNDESPSTQTITTPIKQAPITNKFLSTKEKRQ